MDLVLQVLTYREHEEGHVYVQYDARIEFPVLHQSALIQSILAYLP
jgi:hypothetical protein